MTAPAARLRFAMVTTFYPPHHFGGDAIFVRRLAHGLVRRGHEVDVIHDVDAFELLNHGPPPTPLTEPEGLRVHGLRSRFGALSCLLTQQTGRPVVHGRQIQRLLEDGRFDVIHFHNVSLVGGPGLLAYGDAIKLYMTHEHWLVCPTHVLWRHNRELCTGKECLRCVLHHRRPPQLWRYTGFLESQLEHVDAFYSPSRFSADKHREFGFPRELEVIPHFLPDLDSSVETPAAEERPPLDRPYFLFVGRLEKIKGVQDLLPHFGADAPADLVIVGTGEYESVLRAQAAGLERVHFLGRRRPEELRAFYRHALAALMPSVCYETFGIVLLEAFRDHTPVIARALGPMPEIVATSGGGLLFETADELGRALQLMATDAAARRRFGESGHRALREHWTETVVLRQYFDLIRRIAERRQCERVLEVLRTEEHTERAFGG